MQMENFDKRDIARLRHILDEAVNIVITMHMSPDGDALGSSLGLAQVLNTIGKNVTVVSPDVPTQQLKFLPDFDGIAIYCKDTDFCEGMIANADIIFCLDYNALNRIDRVADAVRNAKAHKVMIDHHLHPGDFCQITISRPHLSSTCMLVYEVICALELYDAINREAAECLLAGMMTDTGNFSYNANDPDIYAIVSELVTLGANHDRLAKLIFDTFSADCLRLNAYAVLEKMKVWPDLGAALITLTRDELNRYNYKTGYTEGLVNKPLAIESVRYTAFLREEANYIKVSMRSKGDFPVNVICSEHFGGGGHTNAAGGEFPGTMQQAIDLFESLLPTNHDKYILHDKKK